MCHQEPSQSVVVPIYKLTKAFNPDEQFPNESTMYVHNTHTGSMHIHAHTYSYSLFGGHSLRPQRERERESNLTLNWNLQLKCSTHIECPLQSHLVSQLQLVHKIHMFSQQQQQLTWAHPWLVSQSVSSQFVNLNECQPKCTNNEWLTGRNKQGNKF